MKALGTSTNATSLSYCDSMMHVSSTDFVATVGELAYFFDMNSRCVFPPATVRPLISALLFSVRNMWDSNTSAFSFLVRSQKCLGSNVFRRCSCFISEFKAFFALGPHRFKPIFRDSCVMIVDNSVGCSFAVCWNSMCASGCSVPYCFSSAMAASYLFPLMLGM